MRSERRPPEPWAQHLAKAVRAVRRARGLSTVRMAELMGLDRRSYTNFEAGRGRLYVARVLDFARATDSDVAAILAAVLMGRPRLALQTADNKMLLAFFVLLGEFEAERGDQIQALETAQIIGAFRDAFTTLEGILAEKQARSPADWLREGAARLGLGPTKPPPKPD